MVEYFSGSYANGKISLSDDLEEISRVVHNKGVAIIKGGFDPDELGRLRDKVFAWAQRTESQVEADRSFHRIDSFKEIWRGCRSPMRHSMRW